MSNPAKKLFSRNKNLPLVIGFFLLILVASVLLWHNHSQSIQSGAPIYPTVTFTGDYRIDDGDWQPILPDKHIPATRGDVTLRGTFHLHTPDGEYIGPLEPGTPISFFLDHIRINVTENDGVSYTMDNENPMFGASACGQSWIGYSLSHKAAQPVELLIHNPHFYGNDTAVDALLDNLNIWVNIDFERQVLSDSEFQNVLGLLLLVIALVLLGTALFSSLLHIRNSMLIWTSGLAILFAGGYFVFSAQGIFFRYPSVSNNTAFLGLCMMFYMLLVTGIVTYFLNKSRLLGMLTTGVLSLSVLICLLLPLLCGIYFYDTWWFWALSQNIACVILSVCLLRDCFTLTGTRRWMLIGMTLPLVCFVLDTVAVGLGWWKGGMLCQYIFVVLCALCLTMVLRIIPNSVNAANRAREMEAEKKALDAELAQSRVSTMISQIRPHFIYNTLGSIEQLCELDPPKAGELVHNFSRYLRGNFGELDNPKPIPVSREIEHVKYYISIENVRFPDMTFTFEMRSQDFLLPALTIQPIVENAIKHGLMKLPQGGSIWVTTFETDTHYCVQVEDNGAGFDTGILLDERKHIGLRNIRGRLEAMVGGTLQIESAIGAGTKVLIRIPKEVQS